ncbi:hypothetical protein IWW39_002009 [Coemansia spiralis]|uniref:Uncharacterized protein n=1 Tax=Coemansia spiralis TaxID=417178 RepID=A0A9W8GLB7_9FUNG|nr:hypothetical protein IWW39_002009 [Coemansia spiralis]
MSIPSDSSRSNDEHNSTNLWNLGPHLAHELWLDTLGLPDLSPLLHLAFRPDRELRSIRGTMVTPPYARILGGLGLFDPLPGLPGLPLVERGPNRSTFPVVSYSASYPAGRASADRSDREPTLAEVMARDSSRIVNSVGEAFGETTRWAVGNLFGQVRDAMDFIESRVHHDTPGINRRPEKASDPMSFYRALKSDLMSNLDDVFPEPTDDERAFCRSYQISMRTMPDGSVETRKTVQSSDGTTSTTVTLHHPDAEKDGKVTPVH